MENSKPIKLIDRLNFREIEFKSITEASIYIKSINPSLGKIETIRANLSRNLYKHNYFVYGFHWEVMK